MLQLTINGGWQQFIRPLRELIPFRTYGNLFAHEGPCESYGRLPQALRESASQADYVVYSYATPIAWHLASVTEVAVPGYDKPVSSNDFPFASGTWVFPPLKYSVSTSKAQGRILTALSSLGFFTADSTNEFPHDPANEPQCPEPGIKCVCWDLAHNG